MAENQIGLEAIFENADFQSGVSEYNRSVSDVTSNTESAGSAMSQVWDNLASAGEVAFNAIAIGVAAAAAAVTAAVGAITAIVFEAADAAGELVDLSTKTGISVTSLQELQYVGDQVGTSLDTITSAQTRLIRSMSDATQQNQEWDKALIESGKHEDEFDKKIGDMALAFNTLRVSTTDANGELRDQEDVFNDVIDALGKIENPVERDALAMQLFGKSAQELNPLIAAGSDELARLTSEAHDMGTVMDEDAVFALEGFGDTVSSIQSGVKGLLGTLAAQALPAFESIAQALQGLFKSEVFKKRLQEIAQVIGRVGKVIANIIGAVVESGSLSSIFDVFEDGSSRIGSLLEVFGLSEDAAQAWAIKIRNVATFVQTALQGFADWFIGNKPLIVGILAAIGAALIAFGITAATTAIATISAFAPIILTIGIIGAAAALLFTAWTENWGGIQEATAQVWAVVQPIFETLKAWLGKNIPVALAYLGNLWTTVLLPAIQAVFKWISTNLIPLWISLVQWLQVTIPAAIRTLVNFWTTVLLPALQAVWNWISTNLFPLFEALAELLDAVVGFAVTVLAGLWQNVLLPAIQAVGDWIQGNLVPIFESIAGVINNTVMPAVQPFAEFLDNVLRVAFEHITDAIHDLIDWIHDLTDAFTEVELPDWLQPGSPTPFELGLVGINKQLKQLASAALPAVTQQMNILAQVRDVPGANSSIGASVVSNSSVTRNYLFGAQFHLPSPSGLIETLQGL